MPIQLVETTFVCGERKDFIVLLTTFSHCLDWVLRGDGNRGMEAGIKKRVTKEGPSKQRMSGVSARRIDFNVLTLNLIVINVHRKLQQIDRIGATLSVVVPSTKFLSTSSVLIRRNRIIFSYHDINVIGFCTFKDSRQFARWFTTLNPSSFTVVLGSITSHCRPTTILRPGSETFRDIKDTKER
ncbi:hypothetical protein G5I_03496 [Acromyrmex echinatior]|uniref:Uncharacterized protein n=1 Tax=Acromyrmex echinatior TaxID=103372 RepID=F4WD46_ACREC|nr:hypothetical protein G5I_03496 [Acromyrmex echinatior]